MVDNTATMDWDLADFGTEIDWEPHRLVGSEAWAGHIPFAFWLVKAVRPELFVELGTFTGNSYFSFCQAIEAWNSPAQAFAVDTWAGDEHAGFYGNEIFEDVNRHNQSHYSAFSTLIRATFDEARPHFDNRRIDILHIDGLHTYEAVRHDFETWRDRVSDKGVVIFHDTNVRREDFGVWKLWSELSAIYPSFEFLHSNGLGVIGVGSDLPAPVAAFFRLAQDPATASAVRQRFSRRGELFYRRAEVLLNERIVADQRKAIDSLQRTIGELSESIEAQKAQIAAQADEFDRNAVNLHKSTAKREREIDERRHRIEISLQEKEAALGAAKEEIRRLTYEIAATRDRAAVDVSAALNRTAVELAHLHDAYRRSTSWRVTAPMRKAIALMRRERGAAPAPTSAPTQRLAAPTASGESPKEGEPAGVSPSPDAMKRLLRQSMQERLSLFLSSNARLRLPSDEAPDVSILLVLYNQVELTFGCLRSIAECVETDGLKAEVILLDNGSSDDTARLLGRLDGATIIDAGENLHFLRGVNRAAGAARGRHILLLNNDAQLTPGSLASAVQSLDADPTIGAIGGRIILPDGTLQEAGSIVWSDGSCLGYLRGKAPDAPEAMFRRDVDYCSGAFLLTPRAVFEELGRLDEAYVPAYYEETDYCLRLWEAGLRVVFDPRIVILHYEFASSAKSSDALDLQRRNHGVFRDRHEPWLEAQRAPGSNPHLARSARSRAPRVLFVDDRVPRPELGSGYPRANDMLAALAAEGAQVTFYPILPRPEEWDAIRRCIPAEVEVIRDGEESDFPAFLRERRGAFDAVLVSRPHNMQAVRRMLEAEPGLLDDAVLIYDAEALFSQREILRGEVLGQPMAKEEADRLLREELELVEGAKVILSVSEQERALFASHGVENVQLLGHMVEVEPTEASFGERRDILFLGAMHDDNSPNTDSLLWFAREVLPELRRQLNEPALRLKVVGLVRAPSVSERDGRDFDLVGQVKDLGPSFESARLVVIPTRFAAGIPHKAHHAASLGVPIVATELIRGQLGWDNGTDCLSADDGKGFATACAKLYRDEALWTELRANALARVEAECSPEAFRRSVAGLLTLVAPQGPNETPPPPVLRAPASDVAAELPFAFKEASQPTGGPVAALVHLFYEDQAASFRRYLENLPDGSDLFLTTDTDEKCAHIERVFSGYPRGAVEVRVVPNRGRDIAPKLVGMRDVHARYTRVLHLHSKASHHDTNLKLWRAYLLESLLGTPEIVANALYALDHEPGVGMVFPQHYEYIRRRLAWGDNLPLAQGLAGRMGFAIRETRALDFPSGSMFWARSDALRPLLDLDLQYEDFAEESGQKDHTIAHAIERLYAMVCEKAGYRWMKTIRRELMIDPLTTIALQSEAEFERFVREKTVQLTGFRPIPVTAEHYNYVGQTPRALQAAANRD